MRWPDISITRWAAAFIFVALVPGAARAQHHHPSAPPDTAAKRAVRKTPPQVQPARPPGDHRGHSHDAAPAKRPAGGHAGHVAMRGAHEHAGMPAFYGGYAMSREASGTAWQPEASPHEGWHAMRGDWSLMVHGFAFLVADHQAGPRGDGKIFSANMLMGMATRPLGPGRLGLRAMLSLEPMTVGRRGYPLLLQTGETADGVDHLIDRQHPHDLFMELATSWSVSQGDRSAFVYLGLPGEPALGPPAFMHRASGVDHPESPIGHHWLDATHITFGVATVGLVKGGVKLEASAFNGREPDQHRYGIETGTFDSYSGRLSWNPTPAWAFQASLGWMESPEQLAPEIDTRRTTVSAMWSRPLASGRLSALGAWGRNRNDPGATLDALLLEGAVELGETHTVFARAERVEKDELFTEDDPRAEEVFNVGRLSAGYIHGFARSEHVRAGIGVLGSAALVPERLTDVYGDTPLSASLFVRAQLR